MVGRVASERFSKISLGKSPISATLVPASLPDEPVSPKPVRNGLVALVVGLALVAAWWIVEKLRAA